MNCYYDATVPLKNLDGFSFIRFFRLSDTLDGTIFADDASNILPVLYFFNNRSTKEVNCIGSFRQNLFYKLCSILRKFEFIYICI